jgi:glycosyltransferase involved in cell wall biosynthesis
MLCVLDPYLRNRVGHFLDYAASIYAESSRRGDSFLAVGAADADDAVRAALPVVAAFRPLPQPWMWLRRLPLGHAADMGRQLVVANWRAFRAMRGAENRLAPVDVFFLPNASWWDLVGLAFWALRRHTDRARFVVFLRLDAHARGRYAAAMQRWLRFAMWIFEKRLGEERLRVATDSAQLAQVYRSIVRSEIEVFPIPHVPGDGPRATAVSQPGVRPVRFLYSGGSRSEQGIRCLVDALVALRPDLEGGRLAVTVQANPPRGDAAAIESCETLKHASLPNVRILAHVLSREDYVREMDESDVVLIPYSEDAYRWRTSGVFAEAAALGKPIITSSGTWMSEQDSRGTVVFESGNSSDLARAIVDTVGQLAILEAAATERQASWTEFHSSSNFYETLMRPRERCRQLRQRITPAWQEVGS